MELVLVRQGRGTSICGHCTVAMLTGEPVEKVINMYGHEKASSIREARNILTELGYELGNTIRVDNRKKYDFPQMAFIRIANANNKRGHFVALCNDKVYCASRGVFESLEGYRASIKERGLRIKQYFEVTPGN